jgi:hypothetical protein
MQQHLTGPFEADFSFINNSDTPVRVHRVDNITGELSESFGFTTLANGETYDSVASWKWFGNRRAAITDENNQCLGVAVMTEEDTSNDYVITNDLGGGGTQPLDSDGDGIIDSLDAFPNDATETKDSDGDGVGDNGDAFPNDSTESVDTDGDGIGDNSDTTPNGDVDSDGDGYLDSVDAFPADASEWLDSDGDTHGDNSDAFPNDSTEWLDSDGDTHGDNSDAFPNDSTEWLDSDNDGLGDNADPYPNGGGPIVADCGATTISSGKLTLEKTECVAGNNGSFYVWVENDNTNLYLTTAGGNGEVGIHFNADTWASASNAQASSTGTATSQKLTVTANRGWRYISLASSTSYADVSLTVSLSDDGVTPPVEPPVEPPVTGDVVNACETESAFTYGGVESGKAVCTGNGHNSYYIYLDNSVTSIDVNTAHGTGNVELYTGSSWPSAANHTNKSTTAGTTAQSITVNNPPTGWFYIAVESTGNDVAVQVDVK